MEISLLKRIQTPALNSPSIYKTDRGSFLVQGWKVTSEVKSMTEDHRADYEDIVEIPQELIDYIKSM